MSVRQRQADSVVSLSLVDCQLLRPLIGQYKHTSALSLVSADTIYQQMAPDNEYYLCLASDLSNRQPLLEPWV